MGEDLITIFIIENEPWVLLTMMDGDMEKLGRRLGEWAWVGRVL